VNRADDAERMTCDFRNGFCFDGSWFDAEYSLGGGAVDRAIGIRAEDVTGLEGEDTIRFGKGC